MSFEDTLGSMRESIRTSLDELASPRSSPTSKTNALKNLERHLATACSAAKDPEVKDAFLALQYTFECNIPSNLLPWIKLSTFRLEGLTSKSLSEDERGSEMDELSSQLNLSLSLLQGIALNHESSKEFLGRKCSLEILLDLLLASRYLPAQPDSAAEAAVKPVNTPHVTSIVLDSLLCILVDSATALRTFEAANGVQGVVKILKRAGTPREVRMKCLEFLYFYLLDETPSMDATSTSSPSLVSPQPTLLPTAPATPIRSGKPYFSNNTPLRPPSCYGSSTYYFSSSSSLGSLSFTDSAKSSSSSSGSSASSSSGGSTRAKSLRSASGSSTYSFSSTSSNASSTAASSAENSPSFMKESKAPSPVFIPPPLAGKKSPVKAQRIATPQNLSKNTTSPPGSPPLQDGGSGIKQAQPRSLMMLRKEVDYVPQSPKKILVTGVGRFPMAGTSPVATPTTAGAGNGPIRRVHRKSLSTSTLGSGAVSPAIFRMRSDGEKAKGASTPLRTRLMGDVVETEGEKAQCTERDGVCWKTTEEKKEFLGTMLGNVDALVEGVRKAGVWGLG